MGWVAGLTEQGDRDPDKGVTREGMGRDTTHQGHRDNKAKPPEARCRQDMNAPTLASSGVMEDRASGVMQTTLGENV